MKLRFEQTIQVPGELAWNLLGTRFAEIDQWFSVVHVARSIKLDEIPRQMALAEKAPVFGRYTESAVFKAVEVLTEYEEEDQRFTFEAINLPAWLVDLSRNTTQVFSVNDSSCTIVIQLEMHFVGASKLLAPLFKYRMTKLYQKLSNALEIHLHTAKAASV